MTYKLYSKILYSTYFTELRLLDTKGESVFVPLTQTQLFMVLRQFRRWYL